ELGFNEGGVKFQHRVKPIGVVADIEWVRSRRAAVVGGVDLQNKVLLPHHRPAKREDASISYRFAADEKRALPQRRRAGGVGKNSRSYAAPFATGPIEA